MIPENQKNEYDKYIEEFEKVKDVESLRVIGDDAESHGFKEIKDRVDQIIANIESTKASATEVPEYQRKEIENQGGSLEAIEERLAEIIAEADQIVDEGKRKIKFLVEPEEGKFLVDSNHEVKIGGKRRFLVEDKLENIPFTQKFDSYLREGDIEKAYSLLLENSSEANNFQIDNMARELINKDEYGKAAYLLSNLLEETGKGRMASAVKNATDYSFPKILSHVENPKQEDFQEKYVSAEAYKFNEAKDRFEEWSYLFTQSQEVFKRGSNTDADIERGKENSKELLNQMKTLIDVMKSTQKGQESNEPGDRDAMYSSEMMNMQRELVGKFLSIGEVVKAEKIANEMPESFDKEMALQDTREV